MLPSIQQFEYLDEDGRNPFGRWFAGLNEPVAIKISMALNRVSKGNFSHVKPVGNGVNEVKVDFGPGYRVYFGWDGDKLIVLLGGGTKKRQQEDILQARVRWGDYKRRKREGV